MQNILESINDLIEESMMGTANKLQRLSDKFTDRFKGEKADRNITGISKGIAYKTPDHDGTDRGMKDRSNKVHRIEMRARKPLESYRDRAKDIAVQAKKTRDTAIIKSVKRKIKKGKR
jgi:hypothetical protein